jgi:hypothetical protein
MVRNACISSHHAARLGDWAGLDSALCAGHHRRASGLKEAAQPDELESNRNHIRVERNPQRFLVVSLVFEPAHDAGLLGCRPAGTVRGRAHHHHLSILTNRCMSTN